MFIARQQQRKETFDFAMERLDSMKEPAKWAAAMSKRAEMLVLVARNVSSEQQRKETWVQRALADYASRLDKLALFFRQLERAVEEDLQQKSVLRGQELEAEISSCEELVEGYTGRCAMYLLMCSPNLVKELQESSKRLAEKIDALCSPDLWHRLKQRLAETKELLEKDFPKPSSVEEALFDSLDEGMLDSIVTDSSLCSKLAEQIIESLGMPPCSHEFGIELGKLRNEREAAEARRGKVHSLYLEQFILVLERAEWPAPSKRNNEMNRQQQPRVAPRRNLAGGGGGGRDAPMLPLQPFICPITRDVMRDPVQIASGQTYERAAIERWFAAGNTRCPVMGEELPNTQMKSNFALKQSIAEWRERNFEARLQGVARQLLAAPPPPPSGDCSGAQVRLVAELRALCEEEPLNKYKVRSMGLIGPMVRLAQESRDPEVRRESLVTLSMLARDNSENQETMVKEGMIEVLVRRLSRQQQQNGEELREVVLLMRVLSETSPNTAELISHAQGAVVFLVTLLGSEDEEVNGNVKAILENVPMSDENVVILAEANMATPLAHRLVDGNSESRMVMAKALARMNLPVASKAAVASEEVLVTLLRMIEDGSSSNEDAKEAALGALHNLLLTPVDSVAKSVIRLGGFKQMERTLSSVKSAERVKIGAARVISELSAVDDEAMQKDELEVYIYKFLQLMGSLTPSTVQCHVLKALIGLAKGELARRKLKEQGALEILLPLLKNPASASQQRASSDSAPISASISASISVRKNAMELFCLLAREFGEDASSVLKQRPEITASLLKTLADDPERTGIVTILASLPKEDESITAAMHEHNVLAVVIGLLVQQPSQDAAATEAALGAVLRFTLSSSSSGVSDEQRKLAEAGVIERLVLLLEPGRSTTTRKRAAMALADMSASSYRLSRRQLSSGWSSSLLSLCLPCTAPRRATHQMCRLHMGECGVRSSFCLLEADAVAPLVALLRESSSLSTKGGDAAAAAAALAALATLTGDGDRDDDNDTGNGSNNTGNDTTEGWKFGCQAIDKAKGVPAVISSVSSLAGYHHEGQRLAITIVERLFKIPEFCARYGASAQMHVIYAAQQGDPKVRQIACRILRRLDLINSQSNYLVGGSFTGA